MNNIGQTVLSQYANSPVLLSLIESFNDAIDPARDIDAFYDSLWNIDTALGAGLDIWGRIVGVSRNLPITYTGQTFGFKTGSSPEPYLPFNFGIFRSDRAATSTYALPDSAYRTLILMKAFANVARCDIPTLNKLARMLFPGLGTDLYIVDGYIDPDYYAVTDRSRAYVLDHGDMTMSYVFDFSLNDVEASIVNNSGVLPHPTGVAVSVTHL